MHGSRMSEGCDGRKGREWNGIDRAVSERVQCRAQGEPASGACRFFVCVVCFLQRGEGQARRRRREGKRGGSEDKRTRGALRSRSPFRRQVLLRAREERRAEVVDPRTWWKKKKKKTEEGTKRGRARERGP